jgi:hypothetical protein
MPLFCQRMIAFGKRQASNGAKFTPKVEGEVGQLLMVAAVACATASG